MSGALHTDLGNHAIRLVSDNQLAQALPRSAVSAFLTRALLIRRSPRPFAMIRAFTFVAQRRTAGCKAGLQWLHRHVLIAERDAGYFGQLRVPNFAVSSNERHEAFRIHR